jgi:cytochrome c
MKKVYAIILIAAFATATLYSCGGEKKEEKKEDAADGYSDFDADEPKELSSEELIKQGQSLVDGSDCKTCHHPTNKIVGPAHGEVAKKYEFTKANVTMLAGKIIKGGQGNWGEIPMTAHADISQADAEKMAMYVLSLDGEKPKD